MPARKTNRKRKEAQLVEVASLYLTGMRQDKIADYLELHPSTITRDLQILQKRWRASQSMNMDEAKGKELAKIDEVEREFWAAWERSKRPKEKSRSGKREGERTVIEAFLEREERDGDPRFLDGVIKCIAKRCEILGLDEAIKIKIAADEQVEELARVLGISREDARAEYESALTDVQRILKQARV